ncbi:MAG TPA: gas vesicle protein K [Bryobacteraceae bacterium]|nr:gas vesicle protein K [Bryobacteraceae bacterium]
MQWDGMAQVESESISDFARVLEPCAGRAAAVRPAADQPSGMPARLRLNLDSDSVKNGLGQLVLTLVKLLHELLERQAIRRIDAGSLTEEQIERLGLTLMRQAEEIERLRKEFGLDEEDLNLDLGPLGKLL